MRDDKSSFWQDVAKQLTVIISVAGIIYVIDALTGKRLHF